MYYTIGNSFGNYHSMRDIDNLYNELEFHFSDIDALGLFVDNHDNPRFLSKYRYQHPNYNLSMNGPTIFSLTGRGIPFVYYGAELYLDGGNVPSNRECLWNTW